MNQELESFVREQKDRQEILDCIMTYVKGIDRLDRDLLESAYHPDALDDHGHFVGPVQEYINWVLDFHRQYQQRTMHSITTHFCELDGDVAHTETYYIYRGLNREAPFYNLVVGRYLDRFEKRDGRWKIAHRICVADITDENRDPNGDLADRILVQTSRDRGDPSYNRPFEVDRNRFTLSKEV